MTNIVFVDRNERKPGTKWSYDPEGRPWRCARRRLRRDKHSGALIPEWFAMKGPGKRSGDPYKPYCFTSKQEALEFAQQWYPLEFPDDCRPMEAKDCVS